MLFGKPFFLACPVIATLMAPRPAVGAAQVIPVVGSDPKAAVIGITSPFRSSLLATTEPARVEQVLAAEGSRVEEGQLVVQLDDDVQSARTAIAEETAQSSLAVDLARVSWKKAERDLQRLVKLNGDDFTSSKELSDAQALAEAMRLEYELAEFNHQQAALALVREQEALEEFRLVAPYSGYVAEQLKFPGETVDQLEGIVRIVQLDPLLVVVDCPIALAASVKEGQRFRVHPVEERHGSRVGKVVLVSKVADGGSQTLKLKLAVPNPEVDWLSGLKVIVELGAPQPEQPRQAELAQEPNRARDSG